MDKGIWATWYDVDEADRPAYFKWLHETWLPALDASGKYLWVTHYEAKPGRPREAGHFAMGERQDGMDTGRQFLLLVGAVSSHVFLDPLMLDGSKEGVSGEGPFLLKRKNAWHAVFVEEQRVAGKAENPDGRYSLMPGPAIRMGTYRMQNVKSDFNIGQWYAQWQLPKLAASNGHIRSRKLACVAGWPKHGIIYEFVSADARGTTWDGFRDAAAATPTKVWSIGPETIHSLASPTLGTRTYPPAP